MQIAKRYRKRVVVLALTRWYYGVYEDSVGTTAVSPPPTCCPATAVEKRGHITLHYALLSLRATSLLENRER